MYFLHEAIVSLSGVTHVRSSIVLKEIKSEVAWPHEQVSQSSKAMRRNRRT
ncbi:hypothetical protein J2W27_004669 [Variovorax boronicumulans]|uniref:hypothetical protein n=1 Tax=Variovorax boronicumulans TaxID=436515 RepID=UPI002786B2A0|nr:hypothetical protein [Variovorax boronicumulans]MDP9912543.1 hypothetical protein [Variovorax boronicumulans]